MNNISLKDMSFQELEVLEKAIRAEKNSRESMRFKELVITACDALETIKTEFPLTEMQVKFHCPGCGLDSTFNLFELIKYFNSADFKRN